MTRLHPLAFACLLLCPAALSAAEPAKPEPGDRTVEQVAEEARPSVVVITFSGRDGKRQGLGTGFVVRADGLIATNLHVLGEARPIHVQTSGGKRYSVTSVHASDRALDLALIKIDAKNLTPLELGDSDRVKPGQAVVAMGNPLGLEHSVVSGVLSARREIDGRPMLQVAIPIERGNSGGPLLDRRGRVLGILTMKSQVTANLGFAMPINALKPLLKKPNPIPMARWLTIGALDPHDWKPVFGAHWRQRAGHIQVEGMGSGFGGRSLCLWQHPVPAVPFEVAVTVRLDDESGAAGLVFHSDGADRHYGFYPTGGRLRLTRFDGPDVFSWKILEELSSPHYHPGEWNALKVRVEKDTIRCYVNDHLVVESKDRGLTSGQVGLAKFRDTRAEFKGFQVGRQLPPLAPPPDVVRRVTKAVRDLAPGGPVKRETVDALVPDAPASTAVLREEARALEQKAARLRQLAAAVQEKRVQADLLRALEGKEEDIDLIRAALLVAKLDNDELDVDAYRQEFDRLGRELAASVPKGADDKTRLAALNRFLFAEHGFHGSRVDYYTRANSYLNEVLDDREGIPLTLAIVYIELGRRVGLSLVGVSLPGHFVVKHTPVKGQAQLIDVFERGTPMSHAEAERLVKEFAERPLADEDLAPARKRAIVLRMLQNLLGVAAREKDMAGALRYLDTILALAPDSARERWMRAVARFQSGDRQGALEDTDRLLKDSPEGADLEQVQEFRRMLTRPER